MRDSMDNSLLFSQNIFRNLGGEPVFPEFIIERLILGTLS